MSDSFNLVQELSTSKKSVKLLIKESYIEAVKKSVGAKLFQNLYAEIDREKVDILMNGKRSCGVFVSRILFMFKLISDVHASVFEVVKDLEANGWQKVEALEPGDVLLWEPKKWTENSEAHDHLGFYIGNNEAISNHYETGEITRHHFTYGIENGKPASVELRQGKPVRKVIAIYRYDFDANYEKTLARKLP